MRSAARLPGEARHDLPALSAAERAELSAPDARGGVRRKVPAEKVGIQRPLPAGIGLAGLPPDLFAGGSQAASGGLFERSADGRLTWTAAFSSEGAGALRLHITKASLPPGSRAYVFAASGETHGPYDFDRGIRPEGFWTNTVFSSELFLEVQFPEDRRPGSEPRGSRFRPSFTSSTPGSLRPPGRGASAEKRRNASSTRRA